MANTTWNPANLNAVTLSGGNLTATSTSNVQSWVKAVDIKAAGAGKFYWEFKPTVWTSGNTGHGFCPSALSIPAGSSMSSICGIDVNGAIWTGTGFSGTSLTGVAANSVIGVAVDLTAKTVWFRVAPAGNWNNSGTANPATPTGGISVSATFTVDAVPVAAFGVASEAVVANFGDSAFSGAVPAGFTAGWPGAAVAGSTQARAMVLA